MKKNIDVEFDFDLSPMEVAKAIWEMDCDEQVWLLARLSTIDNPWKILMQMQSVSDSLNEKTDETQRLVRSFVDELYEYLHK